MENPISDLQVKQEPNDENIYSTKILASKIYKLDDLKHPPNEDGGCGFFKVEICEEPNEPESETYLLAQGNDKVKQVFNSDVDVDLKYNSKVNINDSIICPLGFLQTLDVEYLDKSVGCDHETNEEPKKQFTRECLKRWRCLKKSGLKSKQTLLERGTTAICANETEEERWKRLARERQKQYRKRKSQATLQKQVERLIEEESNGMSNHAHQESEVHRTAKRDSKVIFDGEVFKLL